jgi:hypothetical protein
MVKESESGTSVTCDGCGNAGIFGASWGDVEYLLDRAGWWSIWGPRDEEVHYCPSCWGAVRLAAASAAQAKVLQVEAGKTRAHRYR